MVLIKKGMNLFIICKRESGFKTKGITYVKTTSYKLRYFSLEIIKRRINLKKQHKNF